MSKPRTFRRIYDRAIKVEVVKRMLAGEKALALARELQLSSTKELYVWRKRFVAGGPEALRGPGAPPGSKRLASRDHEAASELEKAQRRIAELERKVGQQQVDLDFFQQALRQVREARRRSTAPGVTGSTKSSKR
jgi:transposase